MSLDVTDRETAPCIAGFDDLPSEREITGLDGGTLHSAMTDSERRRFDTAAWFARFGAYFTPPNVLVEQRPAVATMRLYARRGRYASLHGPIRRLGMAWLVLFAAPAVIAARAFEWLLERPGRFAVTVLTVKALSTLPPVAWLVDHVISPGADAALWLFL